MSSDSETQQLQADHTWLYVRLYYQERTMADTLLLDLVRPLEEELRRRGLISQFFFIRYIEGGHHLRLRFYGERQALLATVRPYLNEQMARFFIRQGYQLSEPLDQGPDGSDDMGWQPWKPHSFKRPVPSYEYDRYEPETERYGGQHGLQVSECHFQQSSYTALRVLAYERAHVAPRQNALLLLLEATAAAFGLANRQRMEACKAQFLYWAQSAWLKPDHQRQFDHEYERFRQSLRHLMSVDSTPALVHRSRSLWNPVVQEWQDKMQGVYASLIDLERRALLTTSLPVLMLYYIHMLCNRLGIFPPEEACLAYMLYRSYAEQLGLPLHTATQRESLPHRVL